MRGSVSPSKQHLQGWYAVYTNENDTKNDHQPIDVIKKKVVRKAKPKKIIPPKPPIIKNVILFIKDDVVIKGVIGTIAQAARVTNISKNYLSSSYKNHQKMFYNKTRQTIAEQQGKGWAIGCYIDIKPINDFIVTSNIDKIQ